MKNNVILISGGASGLGLEYARTLSKNNSVILLSRNKDALESVSGELGCDFYVCDITNPTQIQACIAKIDEKYGKIDVLINNAGIWLQGNLEENSFEQITNTININLLGQIYLTRASLSLLKKASKSLIVMTNSDAGKTTRKGLSVYNASKWGLEGFTKAIEQEFREYNIALISIYPGGINTPFFTKAGSERDQSKYLDPKVVAELVTRNIELYFEKDTIVSEVRLWHKK